MELRYLNQGVNSRNRRKFEIKELLKIIRFKRKKGRDKEFEAHQKNLESGSNFQLLIFRLFFHSYRIRHII